MSRLLLTGATGMVGKGVLLELLAADHQVVALGRSRPRIGHPSLSFVECDLSGDASKALWKISGIDAVVHLAAHLGTSDLEADKALFQAVNVAFTETISRFCVELGVRQLIFASGVTVVARPPPQPVTEDSPVATEHPYLRSKTDGESLVIAASNKRLRTVILRVSSPLPADVDDLRDTVVRKWLKAAAGGGPIHILGDGQREQDFVATADVGRAIVRALASPTAEGIYNIASAQSVSMKVLAGYIASAFGCSVEHRGKETDPELWNVSIDRARRELAYAPTVAPLEAIDALVASMPSASARH